MGHGKGRTGIYRKIFMWPSIKKTEEIMMDENCILVFQDEVHFQVTTSVTRKWASKGSKPKIGSAPGKKNVLYSGYIVPETGELITTKRSWFNYETVIYTGDGKYLGLALSDHAYL